jgi:basic membrane protein A
MKKFYLPLILLLCLTVTIGLTACSGGSAEEPADEPDAPAEEPVAEAMKVALVLNGNINDGGWNSSGYTSLLKLEEDFGVMSSYTENVPQSDMAGVFRDYAELGFNMIMGHGSQFTDAIHEVSPNYPDIQFVIINGNSPLEPNVACVQLQNEQPGLLMGAFGALMSESRVIGMIGGLDIPPISMAVAGFEAGAKFIDPDIKVLTTLTGSFEDAAGAKEVALAYINEGADYVGQMANKAGLGIIEAGQEQGIRIIGSIGDQNPIAPDTVIVSGQTDISVLYTYAYENFVAGTLDPQVYPLGVNVGAVYMSPYHGFEDEISDDIKARMEEVNAAIISGELTI